MNRVLHEIINLKGRKEVLECECGSRRIDRRHMSKEQHHQMVEDKRHHINPERTLRNVNRTLREDEREFRRMH